MRTLILIALVCAPTLAHAQADAPDAGAGVADAVAVAPQPEPAADAGAPAADAGVPEPAPRILTEKDLVENDDYRVRLSLPTEDDRVAWMNPGLRVELSLEEGYLAGEGPSPQLWGTTAHLRLRLRMDRWWSVAATLGYTVARGVYYGTRWTALLEPIFHPIPSLGISLAVGYGGLSVSLPAGATVPNTAEELVSRNLNSHEKMGSCTGSAFVGQARLEYLFVVGPMFSTGPYVVADTQWTSCVEGFGTTDRSSGMPVGGTQWWLNIGGALGWWLSWR